MLWLRVIRVSDSVLIILRLNDAWLVFHPWLPELEHMTFTVNIPKPHTLTLQFQKYPWHLPESSRALCLHGFLPVVALSQWLMGILAAGVFFGNARGCLSVKVRQHRGCVCAGFHETHFGVLTHGPSCGLRACCVRETWPFRIYSIYPAELQLTS